MTTTPDIERDGPVVAERPQPGAPRPYEFPAVSTTGSTTASRSRSSTCPAGRSSRRPWSSPGAPPRSRRRWPVRQSSRPAP